MLNKVFSFTVKLMGGLLSPIAIPLMFGMIYRKATTRGAILSFIGGMMTYLIATLIYDVQEFQVYAGLEILVCLVIYFGESLIGTRTEEKEQDEDKGGRRITQSGQRDLDRIAQTTVEVRDNVMIAY